jgi:hypothetical protein
LYVKQFNQVNQVKNSSLIMCCNSVKEVSTP